MRNLFTFFISFLALICSAGQSSFAQNLPCGTSEMVRQSFSKHPHLKAQYEQQQQLLSDNSGLVETASINDTVLIVPVVIHVMHTYGAENISNEQVYDAMQILNKDFQKLSEDTGQITALFKPIAGNTKVIFRLARKDPFGSCTNGITRNYTTLTHQANDNVKDIVSWNTARYLNVWIVANISFGAGGYAYYPGTVSPQYEGIVCRSSQFGGIGASSSGNFSRRTFTHEVGHYLNLKHTWGDSNTPGTAANCSMDDDVDDTPNTRGTTPISCNLAQNTCGQIDNVENYMDYSSCGRMFSRGQSVRMRQALYSNLGQRSQLWTLSNRIFTGTNNGYNVVSCRILADFFSRDTLICAGSNANFTSSISNNGPETPTYNWTLPGANPSSSNLPNPLVSYAQPGLYSVKLKVSSVGGADSIEKTAFIRVRSTQTANAGPYIQRFDDSNFYQNTLSHQNFTGIDQAPYWHYNTLVGAGAAGQSVGSLCIQNLFLPLADSNSFVMPLLNPRNIALPLRFRFKMAFARTVATDNSRLKVWVSSNCGRNWELRFNQLGASLATTPNIISTDEFVPTSLQWRQQDLAFSNLSNQTHLLVKFEMINNGGNHLYIDDIELVSTTNVLSKQKSDQNLSIQANYISQGSQIGLMINSKIAGLGRFRLTNSLGQQIVLKDHLLATDPTTIPLAELVYEKTTALSPGVYMVSVQIGAHQSQTRVVIF